MLDFVRDFTLNCECIVVGSINPPLYVCSSVESESHSSRSVGPLGFTFQSGDEIISTKIQFWQMSLFPLLFLGYIQASPFFEEEEQVGELGFALRHQERWHTTMVVLETQIASIKQGEITIRIGDGIRENSFIYRDSQGPPLGCNFYYYGDTLQFLEVVVHSLDSCNGLLTTTPMTPLPPPPTPPPPASMPSSLPLVIASVSTRSWPACCIGI